MPTPFNHIVFAQRLLEEGRLPDRLRIRLKRSRAAFLLGNTAPDYGALAGAPRGATHFFEVPLRDPTPAHQRLLAAHPELKRPDQLAHDRAAFLAGYLAHLWLDQAWIRRVFEPYFGPAVDRGRFRERLVAHNLLRAHLDLQDRGRLPEDLGDTLQRARPDRWLPFARDTELRRWRDHLARQVQPGGRIRTVEVFAERLNMPLERFKRQLESAHHMQRAVFDQLPADLLNDFWRQGLTYTAELVHYYLDHNLQAAPHVNRAFARRPRAPTVSAPGRDQ